MGWFRNILFCLGIFTVVSSRPQSPASSVPGGPPPPHNASVATILKSDFVNNPDGSFRWEIETSDGFKAEQSGVTEPADLSRSGLNGTDDQSGGGESVKGSYSYNAPDGQLISLSYVAGKNGFQPMGSHLPTPPPNPFANNTTA